MVFRLAPLHIAMLGLTDLGALDTEAYMLQGIQPPHSQWQHKQQQGLDSS